MSSLYRHPIYQAKHSALPLAFFWATVIVTLIALETSQWLPLWLLLLVTLPLGLLSLMHFYHAYLRISWGHATFKEHYVEQIRRMLSLFPMLARSRSEVIKIATYVVLSIVAATVGVTLQIYSVIAPVFFLLGTALTASLRAALPPGAVYLASSSPENVALFGRMSAACIYGVNALLDVSTLVDPEDELPEFYRRAALVLNDCRTTQDGDWTHVARVLIETAPIVLVDGRDTTPGVRSELERILRNKLDFKVCFLSPSRETPALVIILDAKPSNPSGEFFVITPDELIAALPTMVSEAKHFWVPTRMVA